MLSVIMLSVIMLSIVARRSTVLSLPEQLVFPGGSDRMKINIRILEKLMKKSGDSLSNYLSKICSKKIINIQEIF
jgi:hypothetical protein